MQALAMVNIFGYGEIALGCEPGGRALVKSKVCTYIHGPGFVQSLVGVLVELVSDAGTNRPQLLEAHVGDPPGRLAVVERLAMVVKGTQKGYTPRTV